jgi:Uma2 family endonuclease
VTILGPRRRESMAGAPIQRSYLTAEEYLALERQAEIRSEYVDGEMVAMAGGSPNHSLVIGNLHAELRQGLKGRPCRTYPGDLRVRVPAGNLYTYPDVVVVCGDLQMDDVDCDAVLNPILIAEVLSPTTESYDRGRKFELYQTLESLREYVLVAQDRPRVEHYLRQDGHVWLYTDVSGLESSVSLSSIECRVPLAEIYDKVVFP